MLTQEWIGGLPELMGQAVEASPAMGYLAVGLVMLLENLIPPIPSEVVMPFAGYLVGQGLLDLVPTVLAEVRTLVSVPAGIERMPQGPFLLWTTAGSLVWTLLLTLAGKALGQGYERVQGWIAPWAQGIERGLVMALAAGLVVWLVRLVWQRLQAE